MIEIGGKHYRELRCNDCRKLIGYERIIIGFFAYICPRCKRINQFDFKMINTKLVNDIIPKEFILKGA